FATTLGWPDAGGLLPGADGAGYAELHLTAFNTSFIGLFDGSVWKAWADLDGLTNNIVGTLRLLGESFAETDGLPLLIAASWGLAAILSVSNARAESRLLRASGLLLAFVTLLIVHIFNNYTHPGIETILMMLVALVLAFLFSQWPIEVDPNTANLSGTALRMVRQTAGALFIALGIVYFTGLLSDSPWYIVLWSLGSAGAIATMTNPLLGPPIAFAAVIITLAGENLAGMLAVTGLLFLYLLITFFFDKTRPRRWNPLGAGLVLGGPGLAAAGLLPMGVLSLGALEAQVPATLLALAAQGFLIFTAAQAGGASLNPLTIIIQLLATLAGVLLVERLMAVDFLRNIDARLRRLIYTVVMGFVLAFAYSVLGGASPGVPIIQALFVGLVSAAVLVITMGERALYWREFIEHEEKEEEVLEEDEITGASVAKARRS
ncbi:MAG: hypothetical protein IT326_09335, partial [Anaerolineae bacterium]|nr:hypothetical protein [Anaerolineae bacterium]